MEGGMVCQFCKRASVHNKDKIIFCTAADCNFFQINPITYQNDTNAYDAQERTANRYSQIYTPFEALPENERLESTQVQNSFFRGKKYIFDCGHTLKLSQTICGEAVTMLTSILKAVQTQKNSNNKSFDTELFRQNEDPEKMEVQDKSKKGKGMRYKNKNIFSVRFLAAYSLHAICFLKQNYFQEFNIIREFRITLKEWRDVNKQMNSLLREYLQFVPVHQPKHIVIKVCKKRHINSQEQAAMVEMAQRITQHSHADVRSHTIAAIAFWKVCQFSSKYKSRIDLRQICKSHERMIEKGLANQTYAFFDITPQNVKKVYREYIKADLHARYLPIWATKTPIIDQKGNNIDYE